MRRGIVIIVCTNATQKTNNHIRAKSIVQRVAIKLCLVAQNCKFVINYYDLKIDNPLIVPHFYGVHVPQILQISLCRHRLR